MGIAAFEGTGRQEDSVTPSSCLDLWQIVRRDHTLRQSSSRLRQLNVITARDIHNDGLALIISIRHF